MLALIWTILSLFLGITAPLPPVVVDPPEPSPVVVTPEGSPVSVVAGTTERIHLGVGNPSIGDGYSVIEVGDAALVDGRVVSENETPGCKPGGCTYSYFLVLTGVSPGTTTVTTQYCYRSGPPTCDDQGKPPVEWAVTVTEQ